jgi:HPt (histidine-containing phosphotransfer) domain-containing protein
MIQESQVDPQRFCYPPACLAPWSPPATIQELAGEENDLVSELIQSYTVDMQERLQRIRDAMISSNLAILRCEIHTIKGTSKQMAANGVASLCEQIEAVGRERNISELAELVTQLEVGVNEVCDAMAWYRFCEGRKAS